MRASRWAAFLPVICGPILSGQAPDAVTFTLAAKDAQTRFRVGEAIELEFRLTSSIPNEYGAWTWHTSRTTRQAEYDHFTVEPADSVVDPLADSPAQMPAYGFSGPAPKPAPLTSTPVVVGIQLNEWLSIRTPGHYRVTAATTRVVANDEKRTPIPLRSNTLEIDIIAPEAGWAAAEFQKAIAVLETSDPPQPRVGESFDPRVRQARNDQAQAAARTLRLLETPEAAAAMARFYRHGPEYAQGELDAGLFASPYRKEVIAAMEAQVAAPDIAIDSQYLDKLIQLVELTRLGPMPAYTAKTPEEIRKWTSEISQPYTEKAQPIQAECYAKLGQAISLKQGPALAVSLQTMLARRAEPPSPAVVAALIANFHSLPENSQTQFLSDAWPSIASPAIAPLVEPLAEGDSGNLRDAALSRLQELNPDAARKIILDRLRTLDVPQQIHGASRVLLELPEQTLPELDSALVESVKRYRPGADVLLARYGSAAIAKQLEAWVEQTPPEFCNRPAFPAYFFRVDPDWAAAMVARVRAPGRSNCTLNPSSVDDLLMSPGLEKQTIADLSSSEAWILRPAETLLQNAGLAAAEKPLLEGMARLHDAGVDPNDVRSYGLEQGFVSALLTANRWVASEETFAKVASLCVTDQCKRQVSRVQTAQKQPIPVGVDNSLNPSGGVSLGGGSILLQSDNQLRERLTFYPKGTQFYLGGNSRGSWYFEQRAAVVRRIFEDAGMKIVDPPPPLRR